MISRTASSARKEFSDTINRVIYLHERVILERHGKPVAVILPMDEYAHIEKYFESGNTKVPGPDRHTADSAFRRT